ncbi:hypothetical protein QYZ88_009100 [Lachnospiraceae bacterium C1.1]|nr:hypothetical protein [Lachnospiraceae bacterium C1.1]
MYRSKGSRTCTYHSYVKTHEIVWKGSSADEIVSHIQSEHCLNKKAAKDIAPMYLELFNDENKKSWKEARWIGCEAYFFCQG